MAPPTLKQDLYAILEVSSTASTQTITQSYRRLAKIHHPDKGGPTEWFQQLQNAYETIIDPAKRKTYDSTREPTYAHPANRKPTQPTNHRPYPFQPPYAPDPPTGRPAAEEDLYRRAEQEADYRCAEQEYQDRRAQQEQEDYYAAEVERMRVAQERDTAELRDRQLEIIEAAFRYAPNRAAERAFWYAVDVGGVEVDVEEDGYLAEWVVDWGKELAVRRNKVAEVFGPIWEGDEERDRY